MSACKVWIDQDLCTGDGICAEIAPKVFEMHEDGLAYVKQVGWPNRFGPSGTGPEPALKMGEGLADVPENLLEDVIEAMEACPGECIMIELEG
jgi:ferredoxin